MKITKMKSHNFPLLYYETFRKMKLKVSRRQSGTPLFELFWAWGKARKERQEKEATFTYLQGQLILQAQQLLRGGSRKFSHSNTMDGPMFCCLYRLACPKAKLCCLILCSIPISWVNVALTNQSSGWHPLHGSLLTSRNSAVRKYNLKVRTQNQVCRNRLASSDLFMCI